MFQVEDRVEIISDGRIGTIKETRGNIDAVNMPGALEVVNHCRVQFGNDFTKFEWFKPEQLRVVK
jgi:hypothetical protein